MPRIFFIFITIFSLISSQQSDQSLIKALDFETYQEARSYLSENSIKADRFQFIKPEEISFEYKIELVFIFKDEKSESVLSTSTETVRRISLIKYSFWDYSEIRYFLKEDEKKVDNFKKSSITSLSDVINIPLKRAEAEAFWGETGFWLKKGFIAKKNKDYYRAFDYWKKAYDKNKKNWLVRNFVYNLASEGVRFCEKNNKAADALKLLSLLDLKANQEFSSLKDKKNEIITSELKTVQEKAKNGKYEEALALLNLLPIEFDEVDYRLYQQAQEIRNNINSKRLVEYANQFPSGSLKEDQIAEWLEKGIQMKKKGGLYSDAIKIFSEIIAKFPQHPLADDARYELGACYYLSDPDTIDVPHYFKSLKARSDTLAAKITYMIARCYRDRELAELAEYYYQKVADQYPQSRFADDALIILAYDEKDYLRSIPKYQKIIKAHPQGDKAEDAAYKIAQLLFRTAQYDKAVDEWKRYLSNYSSIPYYYKEAAFDYLYNCYYQLKNPVEMEYLVKQALRENMNSANQLIGHLARIYYYEFNNKEKAKAVLQLIPQSNWDSKIIALSILFEKDDFTSYFLIKNPFEVQEQMYANLKTAQDYYDHAEKIHKGAPKYDLLTRALQLNPSQSLLNSIQYKRGRILFDADEYWEAIKIFDSNQIKDSELYLFSQYYKASSYYAIGNINETNRGLKDICQTAEDNFLCDDARMRMAELEFRPEYIKSHLRKIVQYTRTGDMAESAADWLARIYLRLDRNYDSTLYVIDHELSNYSPKFSEDLQYYKEECIYRKGLNLIVTGQFQQAEDYFKNLYFADNEEAIEGLCELSDFLKYEKKDLQKAKAVLKIAETLSPKHRSISARR